MGKSQSKELDDIILNIYAVLEKPENEFDVEDVLKYTRQLSKSAPYSRASMKISFQA